MKQSENLKLKLNDCVADKVTIQDYKSRYICRKSNDGKNSISVESENSNRCNWILILMKNQNKERYNLLSYKNDYLMINDDTLKKTNDHTILTLINSDKKYFIAFEDESRLQVDVDNIQASSFNEKEKDPFSFTLTHLNSDYGKNCIKEVKLSFYDSDGLLKWVESDKKAIVSNVKNISSNKITIVIITNNIVEIKFENDWYLSLDTSDPLNLNIVYSKNSSINTRWLINDEKDYFSISHTNGSEKFKYLNIDKMTLTDKITNECKIYVK